MKNLSLIILIFCLVFISCTKKDELSLEELEALGTEGLAEILQKTVSKPYRGEDFVPGRVKGKWYSDIHDDPKSFNHLIAEQDGTTSAVVGMLVDYLMDYDYFKREWTPRLASPQIVSDEKAGTLSVIYTLRDDIFWSYYNSDRKVKVTSDDVVFWYNEIEGDPECKSSGYYGQFLTMPDGKEERVTIEKIDDLRFAFHFPRIIADPLLSTNTDFGPKHIFEPAKKRGGAEEVYNILNISVDPKTIPSMGEWFLVEYSPGQRLVYKRNPDFWQKDIKGVSLPYIEEYIYRIIPEENTKLHLFTRGELEDYLLRPEDLDNLINRKNKKYTIFNSEGNLSANFWTFNQNSVHKDKAQYEWFTKKEFRQAMSCLLNRDRINRQVYRGLAQPKLAIFPEPNPYFNPEITLQYLYDPARAEALLASIGIKKDPSGIMRDSNNRQIEFDLSIRTDNTVISDIASIIMDELSKMGIKLNIRVVDFQKQVAQLRETFDWDSMIMGFGGANVFPTQGSNVWVSSGNYHVWHPNQEKPSTAWEARVDYLYNEGKFTLDTEKAQIIWDEFQSILNEELPMIYLMRGRNFWALNNRWDFSNIYFSNTSVKTSHVFLK
jgi:peptide/nickel transport system substrate-binding protein